jgi:hypothetical protein
MFSKLYACFVYIIKILFKVSRGRVNGGDEGEGI